MLANRFKALAEIIQNYPDRIALVGEEQTLTFGQLGRRAAGFYDALSGQPAGLVLVQGHKEPDVIAAMIAATLAGRGFVFAEQSYPAARLATIASTCGCAVLVRTCDGGPDVDLPMVQANQILERSPSDFSLAETDEDLCFYITFTSGSTGAPKGIVLTRRNFAAFQRWFEPLNTRSLGGCHAHINQASMAFDMSMSDIWTALFAGRCVYLLPQNKSFNPRAYLRHITKISSAPVGVLTATPAFFSLMLEDPKFNCQTLPTLRSFWVGGEAVTKPLLHRLLQAFPAAEIHHGYGPSEATCVTHSRLLTPTDLNNNALLPLGRCAAETSVFIRSDSGEIFADGIGEVILAGPQISAGYVPKRHPNNVQFFQHMGLSCYATGDLGQIDAAGNLTIQGRIDSQIKVNGHRIEPIEIEQRAMEIDRVTMAAALPASPEIPGNGILLVLQVEHPSGNLVSELRKHLKETLPLYMQPSKIALCTKFPLSTSGKIDRKQLMANVHFCDREKTGDGRTKESALT